MEDKEFEKEITGVMSQIPLEFLQQFASQIPEEEWFDRVNPVTSRLWWNTFEELCKSPQWASMPFVGYYNSIDWDSKEVFHIVLAETLHIKKI